MPDDGKSGADERGVATASSVSTAGIVDREAWFLAERYLSTPGYWRTFVRARYTAHGVTFFLPGHRIVIETSSLARGLHRHRALLLVDHKGQACAVGPERAAGRPGLEDRADRPRSPPGRE